MALSKPNPAQQQELREFKAEVFQALGHPTRVALVEQLREGERSAGELIEALGLEQANVSQHLTVLRSKQIVRKRKDGNQVYYSISDPAMIKVLDILRQYFFKRLESTVGMFNTIRHEEGTAR